MPKKENLPDRGIVRVTFELPAEVQGNVIHLVGDFTGWEGTPMEKQRDGSWRTTVDLAPAGTYEFRYLIDGTHWENDWHADGYVSNAFGQENSVVTTPDLAGAQGSAARQASRQNPAAKKTASTPAKKTAQAPEKKVAKAPAKKAVKAPAKKAAAKKSAKAPAKKTTAATSPATKSPAPKSGTKTAAKKVTAATSPAPRSAAKKGEAAEQDSPGGATGRASSGAGGSRDEQGRMAAAPRPTATDGAPDA